MSLNIIEAIKDGKLFRSFLEDADGDISSWTNWLTALRVMYGLRIPTNRREVVEQCTGRSYSSFPGDGFDSALYLTGRRSGKSRIAAVIATFEAVLAGHESRLSKGERGIVPIVAPTKYQGRIIKDYVRAVFETPLLRNEITNETREGYELKTGTRIEILAGDWRTIRGYTLLAAIIDEACFFGLDEETKVRSDTELVRAIKPALATVGGRLICISSPYARKGWCWKTYQKNFGNATGRVLVWNSASRTMNPQLPQRVIDDALAEDYQAAKSEYLGEFRDDVGEFIPRAVVENLVVKDRQELPPSNRFKYYAFCDVSGGRGDDAALAIAHRHERRTTLDLIRRYRPPFSPYDVVSDMAELLKRYGIRSVTGDNYAAEFVARAFTNAGIKYTKAKKPKSQLYLELLPRLCSGEIELLDNPALVNQLASLERRTRSGGKDVIDHPPGAHDDLANALAGVAEVCVSRRMLGAIPFMSHYERN
jgi:hypothetical protein